MPACTLSPVEPPSIAHWPRQPPVFNMYKTDVQHVPVHQHPKPAFMPAPTHAGSLSVSPRTKPFQLEPLRLHEHQPVATFPQPAAAPAPAAATYHHPPRPRPALGLKLHMSRPSLDHTLTYHPAPFIQPAQSQPGRKGHVKALSTSTTARASAKQVQPVQGSRFEPRTPEGNRQCTNCGETSTPQWRGLLCNACALWRRARGQDRPVPLRFGGKKVLPPGSRERVKKNVAPPRAKTQPYSQAPMAASRHGGYTGVDSMPPFTFAKARSRSGTVSDVSEHLQPLQYISQMPDQPTHSGVRLPPIGPLLAACPLTPPKQQHSRATSISALQDLHLDSASAVLRFSPSPESSTLQGSGPTTKDRTLPYPIPSGYITPSRRRTPAHTRAASESWSFGPSREASPFAFVDRAPVRDRAEREREEILQPPGSGRAQGHARHASDVLPVLSFGLTPMRDVRS